MARPRVPLIGLLQARFPQKSEKEHFAAILRGDVRVDGERVLKPGTKVPADAAIAVRPARPYVSRGGEKLERALDEWRIDCAGKVFLDAGCSTGGFTDCLLSRGAAMVFAVDVGTNTIAWTLRTDPRVQVRETTNVMSLRPGELVPPPHAAVADLSFRSLRGAAAHILGLTSGGWGIFLVKPQFEWMDPPADFHGVVSSAAEARAIVRDLIAGLRQENITALAALSSPIRGRRGNRELLVLLAREAAQPPAHPGLDLNGLFGE